MISTWFCETSEKSRLYRHLLRDILDIALYLKRIKQSFAHWLKLHCKFWKSRCKQNILNVALSHDLIQYTNVVDPYKRFFSFTIWRISIMNVFGDIVSLDVMYRMYGVWYTDVWHNPYELVFDIICATKVKNRFVRLQIVKFNQYFRTFFMPVSVDRCRVNFYWNFLLLDFY